MRAKIIKLSTTKERLIIAQIDGKLECLILIIASQLLHFDGDIIYSKSICIFPNLLSVSRRFFILVI